MNNKQPAPAVEEAKEVSKPLLHLSSCATIQGIHNACNCTEVELPPLEVTDADILMGQLEPSECLEQTLEIERRICRERQLLVSLREQRKLEEQVAGLTAALRAQATGAASQMYENAALQDRSEAAESKLAAICEKQKENPCS